MFGQLINKKSNNYRARWTINLIIWFIAFWSINYRKLQLYIPLFFQNFEKLKFAKRKIQQMTFLVCDDFNLLIHYALDIFFSLWGRGSIAGFQSEIWRGFEFILCFIYLYITTFIAFWSTNYRKLQFYFPLFLQKFQKLLLFILLHIYWHFIRNCGVLLILASDIGEQ